MTTGTSWRISGETVESAKIRTSRAISSRMLIGRSDRVADDRRDLALGLRGREADFAVEGRVDLNTYLVAALTPPLDDFDHAARSFLSGGQLVPLLGVEDEERRMPFSGFRQLELRRVLDQLRLPAEDPERLRVVLLRTPHREPGAPRRGCRPRRQPSARHH